MFAYVRMKRALLQSLGISLVTLRDVPVLEVGCGTGESTLAFGYVSHARVVGVDIAGEAVRRARRLRDELGMAHVEFAERDIERLGDLGGPFGVVVCEILHQTPEPERTLRGLVEQTAPGGFLVLSVANSYGNLGDVLRYRAVAMLAGRDPERRIRIARKLFFRRSRRIRGVATSEVRDLDALIVDIFGHPYRKTYSIGEVLSWTARAGLRFHGSTPKVDPHSRQDRARGQWSMFRANRFHFEIAVRRAVGEDVGGGH
jgi:SAM-dependent methyltransferase